jgi:predicted phosphatase
METKSESPSDTPSHPSQPVAEQKGSVKQQLTLIFDGDGVIINKAKGEIYPGVVEVIKWCKEQGFRIALASFNVKSGVVLKSSGIEHFFDCVNAKYHPVGKHVNVLEVLEEMKEENTNAIFFDDTVKKVHDVKRHAQVFSFHVRQKGIKLKDVKLALVLFKKHVSIL